MSNESTGVNKLVVSIITVVYNRKNVIRRSIESVLNQTYGRDNIEYIIIDGDSTDGTVDVIKDYVSNGKVDYFVSEKDKGIYDAMNKGLAIAKGDVVAFLNSDDWYEPTAIEKSIDSLLKQNADFSFGDCRVYDTDDKTVLYVWEGNINNIFFGTPFSHQTFFCKRSVYLKEGFYDLNFKYGADYDYMIKLYKSNYKYAYVNSIIVNASSGGVSWAPEIYENENKKIHFKYWDFIINELRNCKYELETLKSNKMADSNVVLSKKSAEKIYLKIMRRLGRFKK
jgi:glycosyltransferase involved in cell wall biosynthesis